MIVTGTFIYYCDYCDRHLKDYFDCDRHLKDYCDSDRHLIEESLVDDICMQGTASNPGDDKVTPASSKLGHT